MDVKVFLEAIPASYYTGVPDSQLKPLCDYLYHTYGVGDTHVIAHNEGGALGLAAGYHLASGKWPLVYMQNSGIGNVVNPVCSLTSPYVYAIPTIFVIGWRGEPNVKDEPQHVFQGMVTLKLLEDLDVAAFVVDKDTDSAALIAQMAQFEPLLKAGKSVAFVIKKGALEYDAPVTYANDYQLTRERAIALVTENRPDAVFVSTTGKASRELFEIREQRNEGHARDFLTVGSMGHSAMIALGVAKQKPLKRIYCIDGDGAALMHLGAYAMVGSAKPSNFVHVLIHNGAHETVGGMPVVAIDYQGVALACGYRKAILLEDEQALVAALSTIDQLQGPILLEIRTNLLSRKDLGRPTTTPEQNKQDFMEYVKQ